MKKKNRTEKKIEKKIISICLSKSENHEIPISKSPIEMETVKQGQQLQQNQKHK